VSEMACWIHIQCQFHTHPCLVCWFSKGTTTEKQFYHDHIWHNLSVKWGMLILVELCSNVTVEWRVKWLTFHKYIAKRLAWSVCPMTRLHSCHPVDYGITASSVDLGMQTGHCMPCLFFFSQQPTNLWHDVTTTV
jgi:hypothetical protein